MHKLALGIFVTSALGLASCGGGTPAPSTPGAKEPSAGEVAAAQRPCGETDKVHAHDIHQEGATEALSPCSGSGKHDYNGIVKITTTDKGIHIVVDATDDEVSILGPDVKTRDAVIVYPQGKGSKKAIEIPLVQTQHGYYGEKDIDFDDLDKLSDEGSTIHVAIFDHDKSSGKESEELHVSVKVSTGKSCEKARDENVQTMDIGKKGSADLTDAQLGAPMKTSTFFQSCGLDAAANAEICVAVKQGKPVGVTVNVTPSSKRVAACIDRSTRRLSFPASDKLDIVHQTF